MVINTQLAIAGCAILFYKMYTDNNIILSIVSRSTVIYRPVHDPVSHICVRHQHYNVVSYFKANVVSTLDKALSKQKLHSDARKKYDFVEHLHR